MSLITTILGVLYISQLVECTTTNPTEFCEHSDTSNPVVLDQSNKSCAERDVYTPPELACAFPNENLRVIHTGQIDAPVTNGIPKIKIEQGGILGTADAVFYREQTELTLTVYKCSLLAYRPESTAGGTIKPSFLLPLKFDNTSDCLYWSASPATAACTTLKRSTDLLNQGQYKNRVVPDNCQLRENGLNHWTTYYDGNKGSNPNKAYIHADIRLHTVATLSRSNGSEPASLKSKRGQTNRIFITNRRDLEHGYFNHSTGIYAFRPLSPEDLCTYYEYKHLELNISRHVQNQISIYHFSPKTPIPERHHLYNYEFNISESDFNELKTVNSDTCYSSDEGYRIISLENGRVVVTVKVTNFPVSDGEKEIECSVRNQNHPHTKLIVDSMTPSTTKTIALPDEIKQDYRNTWTLLSGIVYCFSYNDAVAIWMRSDVVVKKIEYITDNGVAFSNTYGTEDVRAKVPTLQQCTLSGPADRCSWLEKCAADKYCSLAADHDQLECKCKQIQHVETSDCENTDSTTNPTTSTTSTTSTTTTTTTTTTSTTNSPTTSTTQPKPKTLVSDITTKKTNSGNSFSSLNLITLIVPAILMKW
ncbi:hypothetical protein ElyMa_001471900 [Elysia marginata]|uniref:EGF-like domain-containing protein n=1 Tax=Elysia marginata TaxID=1093978 RepID=A0AAV4J376_9GAST|nr:hypothetical protein ElyMa_001471900 [Elysia marginata]